MATDKASVQEARNDLVMSFLSVRRAIGALGCLLPMAMLGYGLTAPEGLLLSMSAAHYSPMREVFVGVLCAQAVFLWSYVGYDRKPSELLSDRIVARVAAAGAVIIALVPTGPGGVGLARGADFDPLRDCTFLQCRLGVELADKAHLVAAAVYFIALALFCLVLFRRGGSRLPEQRAARRIYLICGVAVVIPIGLIGLLFATGWDAVLIEWRPVFWLEVVASFAFSAGWMVKGRALGSVLRDRPNLTSGRSSA